MVVDSSWLYRRGEKNRIQCGLCFGMVAVTILTTVLVSYVTTHNNVTFGRYFVFILLIAIVGGAMIGGFLRLQEINRQQQSGLLDHLSSTSIPSTGTMETTHTFPQVNPGSPGGHSYLSL